MAKTVDKIAAEIQSLPDVEKLRLVDAILADLDKPDPEIEPGVRRCLLARFPYGLIYGLDGEMLVVVAVAHLHREPRYWVDRI